MMRRRNMAWLFLAIAVAVFCATTVFKRGEKLWDYTIYVTAARAYVAGADPYDHAAIEAVWRRDPATAGTTPPTSWLYSIVTPPTLLVLTPWAVTPQWVARPAWAVLVVGLLLCAVGGAARLARIPWNLPAAIWLAGGVLLLGPVQSAVLTGQPAGPAVALIVLSNWLRASGRPWGAGIAAGLATCLKPQLGLPFVVLAMLRPPRKAGGVALGVVAVLAVVSVAPLVMAGHRWAENLSENVRHSSTEGRPNDFAAPNPTRDHMVNLQMPVHAITGSRPAAHAVALGVAGVLGVAWLVAYWRRREPSLLPAATLGAIVLLPVYHRYYDAALLILPLAWAIGVLREGRPALRRYAIGVLVMMTPFALPVGWQTTLAGRAGFSASVTESAVWRVGVMGVQAWAMLGLAVVLVMAMRVTEREV